VSHLGRQLRTGRDTPRPVPVDRTSIWLAWLDENAPLTPIMHTGRDEPCLICLRSVLPGEVRWQSRNPLEPSFTVCRECGIAYEGACGRITAAEAVTIPTHGEPFPGSAP